MLFSNKNFEYLYYRLLHTWHWYGIQCIDMTLFSVDAEMAKPDRIEGSVSFHNVSFGYPTRPDVTVLSNFNLEIPTGQVTALVGKSGCGKSTVASLLMRYYDPNQGIIVIWTFHVIEFTDNFADRKWLLRWQGKTLDWESKIFLYFNFVVFCKTLWERSVICPF